MQLPEQRGFIQSKRDIQQTLHAISSVHSPAPSPFCIALFSGFCKTTTSSAPALPAHHFKIKSLAKQQEFYPCRFSAAICSVCPGACSKIRDCDNHDPIPTFHGGKRLRTICSANHSAVFAGQDWCISLRVSFTRKIHSVYISVFTCIYFCYLLNLSTDVRLQDTNQFNLIINNIDVVTFDSGRFCFHQYNELILIEL
jgi:hypothetical protein